MNSKDRQGFCAGSLFWSAGLLTAAELAGRHLKQGWDDGFAAFSNAECRLGELGGWECLAGLLEHRIEGHAGLEGFLMEGGLWRRDTSTDVYEELALEREGERFFVQYWRLTLRGSDDPKARRCYTRPVETFARGNLHKVFPEKTIQAFEVIVPEDRLRFYLTRGQ